MKNKPGAGAFRAAVAKLPCSEKRLAILGRAGDVHQVKLGKNEKSVTYFQCAGISPDDAKKLLKMSVKRSTVPESVRIAHFIATGVVYGESHRGP